MQPPVPAKTGADGWPWWYSLASFGIGIVALLFVIGIFGAVYTGAGGDVEDPAFLVIATIVQGLIFAGAAIGMARMNGPVSAVDFGLRRARLGPTIGKIAAVLAIYFVALSVYSALVHLTPDDSADKLGAADGALGMIGFVVMAAMVAPVAEEFFFRGMVFRSLANGIGVAGGAIVSGLIFGAMHIDSLDHDRLLQVVPLALLGVLFAVLYAWSGTLYSTIALHATNNALAVIVYSSDHNSTLGLAMGAAAWVLMMAFCLTGWRLTDRGATGVEQPPRPGP
ncbi:MAG: CPBP family intramembrane metalloprotease [Actinobacteria bacterium]|nr:CPBP family intramembrane metalloprotease [Actinomycetota bacterium]